MSGPATDDRVTDLLREADAAFAAGDADRYAALFAEDAQLLLLHGQPVKGRAAIRDRWRSFFARFDTSAWEPRTELVEVHGGRAYTYGTYTERLRNREDGSGQLVRGRLIHFLRREADGARRIWLIMNSHSQPVEPLA
jgi:uncharacterized protein (TIGR02246 family)